MILQHRAPTPNLAAIPAELTARRQWVCWCYALDKNGKPTKIPYTPGTTRKASHSRPTSWRSFAEAVASYQARPDFFAGIGYVFTNDDPYVGGDIDHNLDLERVPPTYAEISPSGNGIKFIARATGGYGRKTPRGELYSSKRFFTITGHVIPGHETITDCQAAIEAFAASLGNDKHSKAITDGAASAGDRAALAASHTEAEYEEGRRLLRTSIDFQVRCLTNSAKEGTQLAYLLAGDYAGFHAKWSAVGLYRADGSLDDSQIRAVMARSIYGRGFTFPRYCALMSHFFAAQALAKWGTKQAWREELAALWHYAINKTDYTPRPIASKPEAKRQRGRANSHAATVEQVYRLLLEHRAGTDAIIHIADIAAAVGVHRRTITSILDELRAAERITTKRLGGGAGLLVTFDPKRDVIIPVVIEASSRAPVRVNDATHPPLEETSIQEPVFLLDRAIADHISEAPATPHTLSATVALVLSQVDPKEFGRARLKTVRESVAVIYDYTDMTAVNREIKIQESIFAKERRDCWRMQPDALFARIQARTTSLTRNIGKRQEGKYRKLAEIANEVCKRRRLKLPERVTKVKPVTPHKRRGAPADAPMAAQLDMFSTSPASDLVTMNDRAFRAFRLRYAGHV